MNDYVTNLTLDLNCSKNTPTIDSAQFDKGRVFSVAITADGEPYSVAGCQATLKCVHSDKSSTSLDCTDGISQSGNTVTVTIREDTLPVRGLTAAKLVFTDGTRNYSTQIFIIDVDSSLDGNVRATEAYSIINKLIDQVHALNESGLIIIDNELKSDSTQPVENRVVKAALDTKANATDTYTKTEANNIFEAVDNKVTQIDSGRLPTTANNTQYPSVAALKSLLYTLFYTKEEVDDELETKADYASTLAGYGITDAAKKADFDRFVTEAEKRFELHLTVGFDENGTPIKWSDANYFSGGAFASDKIASAFVAANVTSLYSGAFAGCHNLTDLYIDNADGYVTIQNGALPANVTVHYKGSFNATNVIIAALITLNTSLQNKADTNDIPTKTSDLSNDSGFLTSHQDVSGKENTSNKANSITNENKRSTTLYPSLKAVADYADGITPDLSAQMKRADPNLPGVIVPIDSNSEPDMTSSAFNNVSIGQIFVCIVDEKPTYWIKESASSCKNLGSGGGLAFDSGYVDRTTGEMHLTMNGTDIAGFTPFFVGTGSGGGVGINLTNVIKPSSVRNDANAIFSLTATATDDSNITVSWYVNGTLRATEEKTSGNTFSFNAKDYLRQSDTSEVRAAIASAGGASITRQWSITTTAFSIAWGVAIQPITLYTENNDVYAVVVVSAQPYTENIVTVSINNNTISKDVVGSADVTFRIDKSYFNVGVNTVTATMVSGSDANDAATPISFKAIWAYGANSKIAAFAVSSLSATQYDLVNIYYFAYDPDHDTASCEIQIGSEAARSFAPNRTLQTLPYVPQTYGTITAELSCDNTVVDTLQMNVAQSQYNIGKVTGDNLVFNLDPVGHSNTDADKEDFCNIAFSNGFDWVNGGFHSDDGAPAFVVKKGHRATLPREIFGDADGSGKTIDISFRIRNSDQFNAVAMQELNNGGTKGLILRANDGELRLNNSAGKRFKYCEDSRIDMSINVESINDHRVMTVWLDGVQSQANKYSAGTLVQDENPLVIGSDHCDVWVYAIRVYNSALSIKDMIQNFVSLAPTTAQKIQRFRENDVYDGNKITPASLHAAKPELTIVTIGAEKIPEGKGDEHYVNAVITIQDGANVLTLDEGTRYRDQGTSTMAYGRSAYNMDIEFSGSGKTYKISSSSIPVTYLNIKVNVPSSDNANNVNGADWYNENQPYRVPGRSTPGVRDTIEGKPCAVFFRNTSNRNVWAGSQLVEPGETVLYAMGDLCNSKKNYAVFAQDGTGEHYAKGCIEVSNNDTEAAKFRATSTYNPNADDGKGRWESVVQTTEGTKVVKDFEWRKRPKAADLDEVVNAWNTAVAWVVSTIGNYQKFVAEVDNYFAIDSLCYHFLYLEFFGGYDNVSKNTFYSYEWDETLQRYVFNITKNYDDDTILGCDNDGIPLCDYGADFGDKDGTRAIFNADTNTIWVNIQAGCYSRLASMYKTLRGLGAFTALDIIEKWDNYQGVRPRAAMAQDAYNKYILPWKTDHVIVAGEEQTYDDTYLARCQGPKTYPRKEFITYNVKYMDGKYGYYSTSATLNFRANAPEGTTKDLTVKAYAKTYATVIIDNEPMAPKKIETGGTTIFYGVPVHSNATIYFTPESLIERIVPIDDVDLTTFKAAGASKLIEATLGNAESENEDWGINGELSAPSPILKTFSIRNIVNFSSDVDLSANVELEYVDTRGTKAGIITLPSFAPLQSVNLNACSGITALNLNSVTSFSMESGNKLTSIRVENCNSLVNLAILSYLTQAVNAGGDTTRYIRMTGINWTLDNPRILNAIASKWKGYNDLGAEINTPYLSGEVTINAISSENLSALRTAFMDLTITPVNIIPSFTVTFKNYDGSTLNTQSIDQGGFPVDPRYLEVNPISTPVKPSTAAKSFSFEGWSWTNDGAIIADVSAITILQDTTIYTSYSEQARRYSVTWKNGSDIIGTPQEVYYGESAVYSGPTPTNSAEGSYSTYYLFKGWDKSTINVKEDLVVNALYESASPPMSKTLSQMTPTELNALVKAAILSPTGENNTLVHSGDTIDIIAGNDYSFLNVTEHELVQLNDPKVFDGTNYYKPQINSQDIHLFDIDKSFTLAIDFAYDTSSQSGGCLASCFHSNGFLLRYASGGSVRYGQSSSLQVSSNGVRQIIVIRKIAGDDKLYVYGSNKNGNALTYSALSQSTAPSHSAPLCFGASIAEDSFVDSYGKGTVFWAKLWDDDLGDAICRDIAAWPRQTFTMQAVGSTDTAFRTFKRVDNQKYVNCAFLLKDLLEETHVMNPSNSNAGGWKAMPMRTWLNDRLFTALPYLWRQLILTVYVHSNTGQNATGNVDPPAEDKIWIPCMKDMGFNVTTAVYSDESDAPFSCFTTQASKIKKLNLGAGAASNYWLRSPSTYIDTNFYCVAAAGSSYAYNSNLSYGVAFGFCI